MGALTRFADGIMNVVSGLGTSRDKAANSSYVDSVLQPAQLVAAYKNSWLAAAIVDYPAEDATRKWRAWRAKADQITRIETLEAKLDVKRKVQDALIASRLYGGAAIYINTGTSQPSTALRVGEEIKSLVVMNCQALASGEIDRDISSIGYGKPKYYTVNQNDRATRVDIHPSRFILFPGKEIPADVLFSQQQWGDSVLQSTYAAIQQTDGTMANIASLVFEAKINIYKFAGFADLLSQAGGDAKVLNRLVAQTTMKGINGDVVIDKEDEFDQRNTSFSGLDSIATKFEIAVSGASKIPLTRLFGRASAGLSGSGDGDERVYYDRIGDIQTDKIGPSMTLFDDCLIQQALGSRPPEVHYQWRALRQLTESERAEIFSKTATAARTIAGTTVGELIPLDALSEALANELYEQGVLPGLEDAIKKYGSLAEQSLPDEGLT